MPRLGVMAVLAPALFAATMRPAARASMLVFSESGAGGFNEALSGVSTVRPSGSFRPVDAAGKSFEHDIASALQSGESQAAIAVGCRALAEVRARHAAVPVSAEVHK